MNTDNIVIRPFEQGDKEIAQAFFDEMGERSASFFNINRGNERRTMEFFENGKKDHLFWAAIAEENGKTVMAGLVFIWDLQTAVPWLGIAVRDSFQGRRLGQRLLEAVFDYCRHNGCGGILLRTAFTNEPAQKLYERCGFARIGNDGKGEYLYIKRLERMV